MDDLEDACKNACKGNTNFSREEFLCSGKYVSQGNVMRYYGGYDPCPNDIITKDAEFNIQDPWEKLTPIIAVLVVILIGALAVWFIQKR